jgi:CheY-like chemotaxis protein
MRMSMQGPLVVVENDKDDQEIFLDAIKDLGITNPVIFFERSSEAYQFLLDTKEQPLIIVSDINLPGEGGVEFKRRIDNNPFLREKSIPFIFFSTFIDKRAVDIAYKELTIQGFFRKSSHYEEYRNVIKMMIDYWKVCQHPNSFAH